MDKKRFITFALKVIFAHVVTYFIIGTIAYQFLTKPFYVGVNPIFAAFMRTEAEPDLWRHVMTWLIPGQVLRGLLIAVALSPFFNTLVQWNFRRRFFSIAGLYLALGFWASTMAAPGTIDGMIYMRPEITMHVHLMMQPEIITQGLLLAAWVARWMVSRP
jgi:hypothetical protein